MLQDAFHLTVLEGLNSNASPHAFGICAIWKGIAVAILMCLDYIVPLVVESPANGARRVQYPGSRGGILAMRWKFFP